MLNELFDTSIEHIDWGNSSGSNWTGIFFVPVVGMNQAGAQALREKQRNSAQPWATPPGHIKYLLNVKVYFAAPKMLLYYYDLSSFNFGKGILIADVSFKRFVQTGQGNQGYMTYERPQMGERMANDRLVFGTVIKGIQDIMERGANITGVRFVSHQDYAGEENAAKRLSVYKRLASVIAPRYGFVQVPHLREEADILLVKKEFQQQQQQQKVPVAKFASPTLPGQPTPPMAIPVR